MLDRPVFVLGAPRAGTSVLGRLIGAHPSFHHVTEPRFVWRYGNDHLSDSFPASSARPNVVRHITGHFESHMASHPGKRLLEKTPSNSLRVPFIEAIFPDAQYIHVTRNGYDAVLSAHWYWQNFTKGIGQGRQGSSQSILRQRLREIHPLQVPYYIAEFLGRLIPQGEGVPRTLWGPRLPGMRKMLREMDLLEVVALQWRTCVERARIDGSALGPDRYFELRLEDLNEQKLEQVFNFLGVEYQQEAQSFFAGEFKPSMTGSRRDTLAQISHNERAMLRRMIEPTSSWLGYLEP